MLVHCRYTRIRDADLKNNYTQCCVFNSITYSQVSTYVGLYCDIPLPSCDEISICELKLTTHRIDIDFSLSGIETAINEVGVAYTMVLSGAIVLSTG